MKRIALLVAALVITAPLVGAGTVVASDNVTLTVTVTDDDENAVGGAQVAASWDDGERTDETRSNGRALIDVPSGADVEVDVEHDDLVLNNPKEVGTVSDHTTVAVDLYPEIDGEITIVENDTPIADATVTLTKDGDTRAAAAGTTDDDGVFVAEGVEVGSYDVDVEKAGYYDESTDVDLRSTDGTTVALESGTERVTFSVVEGYFDEPLRTDVTILQDGVRDATLSTNADGERTIPLVVNTEYTAVIEDDGYDDASNEREFTVGESATEVDYVVERAPALTLEASNERVLVGETVGVEVTDEYGDPVDDAEIVLDGSTAATTDADGEASVTIETHGELELTAQDGGVTDTIVIDGVDPDATNDSPTEERSEVENASDGDADESIPGFGAGAAGVALALVLGGAIAYRRRSRRGLDGRSRTP
ncbi:carboxypeptidase-like regulatory domain-containing protein [Natronococcus wangiae]|uniref:carboxypeptidase-like regulatory domain-containing protein n=1 Tax=Natronococcus wangiae TaxID=3068275 RepID=UPI00273D20AA|nr:carboxypeptidase-like regulatory domain-containing protein [Natronococcus sp. AD5]